MCSQSSNPYHERMILFMHNTKKKQMKMGRYQRGEVMLVAMVAMMVAMVVVVWQGSGHMGMGHGAAQAEKSGQTEQQTKAEQPPPASKESPEPQH